VYQHAWAQRTRTPYSTYRASGVTPDPMPHTFGPRCRSRDLPSGVIPGSMDPGISPLRYIAFALGLGLRPLGLLLCLTSGPLVLRSNPRASSCSGSLWIIDQWLSHSGTSRSCSDHPSGCIPDHLLGSSHDVQMRTCSRSSTTSLILWMSSVLGCSSPHLPQHALAGASYCQ